MQKQIAIAVVERATPDGGHEFLIAQRPAGVPLAGLWEFPGGKIESDESPAAAALRECLEETGLEVEIVSEYPDHLERYEHGEVHLRFFRCQPISPEPSPREPWRWVAREQLAQYEFPEGNRTLLGLLLYGVG